MVRVAQNNLPESACCWVTSLVESITGLGAVRAYFRKRLSIISSEPLSLVSCKI